MGNQILGNGRQLTIGGLARLVSTWHDMLLGDMLCPKHKISDRPSSWSSTNDPPAGLSFGQGASSKWFALCYANNNLPPPHLNFHRLSDHKSSLLQPNPLQPNPRHSPQTTKTITLGRKDRKVCTSSGKSAHLSATRLLRHSQLPRDVTSPLVMGRPGT
ncbi:hypothetical protein CBM2585_A150017 [Cupriavidus taiwanensis]|nr:hypothetical protein CBM2585_A150017 [Cupriavidus taiwanensis]